jgi:hypothetical protein
MGTDPLESFSEQRSKDFGGLSRLEVYLVALNPFSKKGATWHDDGSVIAFGSNTHTPVYSNHE